MSYAYWTDEQHLESLLRHLELVRQASELLGRRLIREGDMTTGREVIARGRCHDQSKFFGMELEYLHRGPDVDPVGLQIAIREHNRTNDHHPEFYAGTGLGMSRYAIAEMVCDWYARAQEFGTDLRAWIQSEARSRYAEFFQDEVWTLVDRYVDLLLEPAFVKRNDE